jgi:hypothetical protein
MIIGESVWFEVEQLVPGQLLNPPRDEPEWWRVDHVSAWSRITNQTEAQRVAEDWSEQLGGRQTRVVCVRQTRNVVSE